MMKNEIMEKNIQNNRNIHRTHNEKKENKGDNKFKDQRLKSIKTRHGYIWLPDYLKHFTDSHLSGDLH